MNYLLKSKPKNENRKKILQVISFYVFLSVFGFLSADYWREGIWNFSRPIWRAGGIVSNPFSGITNYFSFKDDLINRNNFLEEEIAILKVKELDYDLLLKENQDLKNELGHSIGNDRILSGVLSKPPRVPYDTLVIDSGSIHGISQGRKVYLGENIIIGVVTNITSRTSLVSLFSSGGNTQEAILGRTGASFTLKGKGGGNFELEVPKDADILWGDVFSHPGISGGVIASVYYIDTNSQSSFKTVYLRIPSNVFSSKYVFVERTD